MTDKNKRTEISELGEFSLIERFSKGITSKNKSTIKGIGDDAAVVDHNGYQTVITKDLLVEGVHFDMVYTPLKHLGYKAAVVNFSDVYAMNAMPEQLILGIAVSNRFSVEALDEFYEGIKLACQNYDVDFVGGDTTSSQSGLFLSVTVLGKAKSGDIVYRSGAQENDLVCVSGDLGGAYLGLLLLEREKAAFQANPELQPELSGNDYVLERQLKPEARKDIITKLKEKNIHPTSMIDISDGLASEILHICKQSDKGCALYEDKIPIDATTASTSESFKINPITAAMNGGEDYELLFTIDQKDFEKIQQIKDIFVIGHITNKKDGVNLISSSGHQLEITAQGWDSFR